LFILDQQAGGKLPDSYYEDSNCAIMMFDISSKSSYNKLPKWHQELVDGCKDKNIRMVLIGNMTDDKNRKVKKSDVTFRRKSGLQVS
jgi:GTP-binding nuclear protein Ran